MVHQLAKLLKQVTSIESERKKEKTEIATLHNLLGDFNMRLKKIEANQCDYATNLETTKTMVTQMLNDIPQVTSIEERFEAIEDRIEEHSQKSNGPVETASSVEIHLGELEKNLAHFKSQHDVISQSGIKVIDSIQTMETNNSSMNYPDATAIAEITTELEERNKRRKSMVIHNLPEANNQGDEAANVSSLIEEILQDHHTLEFEKEPSTQDPRLYRLGKKSAQRVRTLKVHLKCPETRDRILANAWRLASSTKHKGIVVQKDMTPLERIHLQRLVHEKNRRNYEARSNQQEANWTIRGGILCRK